MRRIAALAAFLCWFAPSAAADDAVRYRPGPAPSPAQPAVPRAAVVTARPQVCDPCLEPRRGPLDVRDAFVLAHPRLMLPAMGPDTLGCGGSSLKLGFLWSSSFGWRQSTTGENPAIRFYLVDGETRTVDATYMRGLTDDLDVGVRVPFHWRGAGVLDGVIDFFHGATFTEDNKRPDFINDKFRLHGFLEDGTPFDLDQDKGSGLGNVEGIARWRFLDRGRDGLSAAVVGRVTAPTGSEPFDTDGVEAGLQLVAAHRIGGAWDAFAGVGETWFQEEKFQGITYERLRTSFFTGVEWRPASTWSLVFQSDYSTALIGDVLNFAGDHWYVNLGAKLDLPRGAILEVGFVENIINQQTTTDFTAFFSIDFRW